MPKTVDHDERRRELAAAARAVIVRNGIEGTTTRGIAKEAGYSFGVLAHYFDSKDAILLAALELSHRAIERRLSEILEGRHGLDALRVFLVDNLPLGKQQAMETRLEISFWGRALVDSELRGVQNSESAAFRMTLRTLVCEAQDLGEIVDEDPDVITALLAVFIDGMSVHALLYNDRLAARRVKELIDVQLSQWIPKPRSGPKPRGRPRKKTVSKAAK